VREGNTYTLVIKKNCVVEIVENFATPYYVEQVPKLSRFLPSHGEQLIFKLEDESLLTCSNFDKLHERTPLSQEEFFRMQTLPSSGGQLVEAHRNIHFYQDALVVNQTLFLLRDNIIFVVDMGKKALESMFF